MNLNISQWFVNAFNCKYYCLYFVKKFRTRIRKKYFFLFINYLLHAIIFYVVSFVLSFRWSIRHNKHSFNIDINVSCFANSLTQWNRTEKWIEKFEKKYIEIWILQNMKSENIKKETSLTIRFRFKKTLFFKCFQDSRRRNF